MAFTMTPDRTETPPDQPAHMSEQDLADLFENAAIGVHRVAPDGTILSVNQAELDLLGYARHEYVGHHIAEFHADPAAINDILQRLARKETLHNYEAALKARDGSIKHVLITSNVRWEDGRFLYTRCFTRDITQRKRAEEQHRFHAAVLAQLQESIIVTDLDGRICHWNQGATKVFGYSAEEMLGNTPAMLYPNQASSALSADLSQILRGKPYVGEWKGRRKDGTDVWVEVTTTAMLDSSGEPTGFIGIGKDVSSRMHMRRRVEQLQDATAALSGALTPDEVMKTIVQEGVRALGAQGGALWVADMDGATAEVRIADGFPPDLVERFRTVSLDGSDTSSLAQAVRQKHSQWIDDELASVPLVVEERCIGVVAFTFAGTQRIHEEERGLFVVLARQAALALERARLFEQMKRAQEQAAFLAEASDVLSRSLEYEGTLAAITRIATTRLGDWCSVDMLSPDGRPKRVALGDLEFHHMFPVQLDAAAGIGKVLRTGKSELGASHVSAAIRAGGKVLGALTVARRESGRALTKEHLQLVEELARRSGVSIEKALLYREAQDAEADLRKRVEFEQEVVGIVSHDLRNPINAIGIAASLLLRRGGLDDHQGKAVARIISSTDRARRLIADFLDFTQARISGRLPTNRKEADLHELVRLAADELRLANPDRELVLEHQGNGVGLWDPDRIVQLVGNLIGNALQHSPPHAQVRIVSEADEDRARIEVHNDGPPIPHEDIPRLFQPYRRGRGSTSRGGIGLGLYISEKIAAAHAGRIGVRSTAEDGTTFTVEMAQGK